jgi:hypothetical protein
MVIMELKDMEINLNMGTINKILCSVIITIFKLKTPNLITIFKKD